MVLRPMPKNTTPHLRPPTIPYHQRNAMNDIDDLDIELGTYAGSSTVDTPPAYDEATNITPPEKAKTTPSSSRLPPHNGPRQLPPPAPIAHSAPQSAPVSSFSRRQRVIPKSVRKARWVVCILGLIFITLALSITFYALTPGTSLNKAAGNAVHDVELISSGWEKRSLEPQFEEMVKRQVGWEKVVDLIAAQNVEMQDKPLIAPNTDSENTLKNALTALLFDLSGDESPLSPELKDSIETALPEILTAVEDQTLIATHTDSENTLKNTLTALLFDLSGDESPLSAELKDSIKTVLPKLLAALEDNTLIAPNTDGPNTPTSTLEAFLTSLSAFPLSATLEWSIRDLLQHLHDEKESTSDELVILAKDIAKDVLALSANESSDEVLQRIVDGEAREEEVSEFMESWTGSGVAMVVKQVLEEVFGGKGKEITMGP